jgi:hypothetical protein
MNQGYNAFPKGISELRQAFGSYQTRSMRDLNMNNTMVVNQQSMRFNNV